MSAVVTQGDNVIIAGLCIPPVQQISTGQNTVIIDGKSVAVVVALTIPHAGSPAVPVHPPAIISNSNQNFIFVDGKSIIIEGSPAICLEGAGSAQASQSFIFIN